MHFLFTAFLILILEENVTEEKSYKITFSIGHREKFPILVDILAKKSKIHILTYKQTGHKRPRGIRDDRQFFIYLNYYCRCQGLWPKLYILISQNNNINIVNTMIC